jgi:hypothetical protein
MRWVAVLLFPSMLFNASVFQISQLSQLTANGFDWSSLASHVHRGEVECRFWHMFAADPLTPYEFAWTDELVKMIH